MVFEMQRAYNCIAVCSLMRQFSGLVLFGQLLGMPGIHIMLHTLQEAYLHLQSKEILTLSTNPKMSGYSLAHGGLARGLHEGAKVIEKHAAQLCVLAEDCNQPDYIKLVKALCADHGVGLLTVPSAKTLGEWAGLCKIDTEGNARKVVGCSCVVVKDYGETSEGYNVVQEHVKSH
ncbi:40S RIBOSOMAL PROTEIN S12 [Salix purpurea]|uniref:40S ribosomal protein S12 n=1 Tax=Salix purpurea TaxID=77065 RepID=A0A9Q0T922_SALPP|nr:40S RIBOSOMAL PROTEIN S12 [Salix purpurea]